MTIILEARVPPKRRTSFVSTALTTTARDRLTSASLQLSAAADRRLSMSTVLIAALDVAAAHREEWDAAVLAAAVVVGPDDPDEGTHDG
jgi:hypothetical protein